MWVFDGNENVGPIHAQDCMTIGCSYQYLIDICVVNATYAKGKKIDPNYTYEMALRETLREYIQMCIEETWDEFELCKKVMIKEMKRRTNG